MMRTEHMAVGNVSLIIGARVKGHRKELFYCEGVKGMYKILVNNKCNEVAEIY